SGNYAFTGLADGTYTITPSRAGYVFEPPSREVTVSGGDVTGQDFTGISLDPGPPGTTVIIHGHRGATDFEDEGITEDQEWTLTMAQAIIHRIGAGRVYVIGCDPPDTSRGECGGQIVGPDVLEELMPGLEFELGNDWEGENVIVFDWLEESNDAVAGYAEAAADALTALLIKGALDNKWELDRLHFIGHSRGAVVASETIQRLAWHSRNEGGKISGQDVDQNLHFTILDGHPWDDENWDTIDEPLGGGSAEDHGVNTFENQIFWRGGYRREFGVVCWKEIVGYCENYWQSDSDVWSGNANLDGLPGIPGVSNNGNYNLSEKLEPLLFFFTFGHTKVHRWYHGTINVTSDNDGYINDQVGYCENACGPVEADWYSEEGEGCGRKFSRHISGYNRSLRGGGEELASCISVDPSTAVSIYDDVSLMEFSRASTGIIKLYNGDFEYNDTFSLQIPGWSHHCGGIECGGNGGVDALDAMLNAHLELDLGNSWKRHNWLYVPKSVSKIFFRVRVSDGDFEWNENNLDRLRVYVGIETGENGTGEVEVTEFEGSDYPCLDRRIRSRTEYQTCSFSVEAYQGKPVTLRFELDGGGDNNIDSEIWIDDVGFVEPNYLRASLLAAQVSGKTGEQKSSRSGHVAYLHVYDAAGNHTGPTSDSTYVTEIPGSRYIMKYDSLLGPLQTVVLPPATDENAYRFEITSTGAEALVNVAFEDVTQGDRTVTARFEDIPLSAAGVARSAFSAVTPDLAIDIDDNGDGVPEDTLSPGVFSKNFFILASAGEGGSITPTGTNVATYGDTLSFSIIPDEGWVIDEVMVDSMSLGSIESYSFENIRADHTISAVFRPTGVDVENDDNILPDRYDLQQNYPNPFASRTSITYSLPVASHVSLKLYDVLGREVMVLVDEPQQAGYHTLTLDASEMSAGIYFYQLQAGSFMATRALMIVK
ncbi:MAG: T9SS C-terminal target domain-containing protein, partial [Bacteroidetes bacterium]